MKEIIVKVLSKVEENKLDIEIKNPGAFRRYCKRKGLLTKDGKVSLKCIREGLKSPDKTVRKRARLALLFRKWNKRRRK